jgi:hypothetical protein
MRIHGLMRNLLLGGMLLSTACSSESSDDREEDPPSDEQTARPPDDEMPSAGGEATPPPAFPLDTTGIAICFDSVAVCTPPGEPTGEQPEGVLEVNLTDTPDRKDGEPTVAVNPRDPDNLVAIYAHFEPGNLLSNQAYGCALQYSMDRGETWTLVEPWPPEGTGPLPDCGESVIEVDADGTFYAGMNNLFNSSDIDAASAGVDMAPHIVSSSRDGGRTWSTPVAAPYKIPGVIKARVDQVTGKLYHTVSPDFLFPLAITVSSDQGLTWSEPVLQPGAQYAVHDGILAMAAESPNVTVHFSTDDGQTFTALPVTDSEGTMVPAGATGLEDPSPWISADPTQTGRFAVMVPQTTSVRFQAIAPVFDSFDVYVTDDSGETWTGPTTVEAPWSALPWIEFGSGGALGIAWRGISQNGGTAMVDAYAVVSFDSGGAFSAPVRVNAESHPWGDGGPPADDWSGITLDDEYAFVTWVDVRSGNTGDAILARVPLSAFRDASD